MAQQYFTNEIIHKNAEIRRLGIALKNAPYSNENIDLSFFFLTLLQNSAGREVRLQEFFGHFDKGLFTGKSTSFTTLIQILNFVKILVHDQYHLEDDLFGFEPYAEDAEESVFGLAKETSSNNLTRHIHDATLLLSLLSEARRTNFQEITGEIQEKIEEETPPPPQTSQEDVGAFVGSAIVGGGSSSKEKKKDDEKKKKENEEKDKEEEKKKPPEAQSPTLLRDMAQADRYTRNEILRIQSAISYQLASVYGIPEKEFAAFQRQISEHISPIIYTHLHKLDGEELQKALGSQRTSLYLQVLSSLQRNQQFQGAITAAAKTAYKNQNKVLTNDDVKNKASNITLAQVAQGVDQKFSQVLDEEIKAKNPFGGEKLSEEQIQQIVSQHQVGADTIESSIRKILEDYQKQGQILVAESEINSFFIRLQSYGVSKRFTSTLSESEVEKFYDAFSQSFGKRSPEIIRTFQQIAGIDGNTERALFANFLLAYSDKITLAAYHNSGIGGGEKNLGALYAAPQHFPEFPPGFQKEVESHLEKEIGARGHEAVSHAFFTPLAQLQAQLGNMRSEKKQKILQNAIDFHEKATSYSQQRARTPSMRQRTIYYILSTVFGYEDVQSSLHFGDFNNYSIFQESPSFLLSLAPEEFELDLHSPFSEPSSAEKEEQKRKNQESGLLAAKALGFIFLGPESVEVLDKAWQIATTVRSVVEQLPGGEHLAKLLDFLVFDKFEQMGKFFNFLLAFLAATIGAAIGGIIGTLMLLANLAKIANLSSLASGWLSGLMKGISSGTKAAFSGLQSGATALSKGAQNVFTQLSNYINSPIRPEAAIYFTGGLMGTAFLLQTVLFSAFLTPRTGGLSSGILNVERRNQPPNIGCLKPIIQPQDLISVAGITKSTTGSDPKAFSDEQIQQLAQAAGQVFASPTYKNMFCSAGEVKVIFAPDAGGAGFVSSDSVMLRMGYKDSAGTFHPWSQSIVAYSLIHEMGHVLDNRNNFQQRFAAAVPITGCFPTYPNQLKYNKGNWCETHLIRETFAEATVIYIMPDCYVGASSEQGACGTFNFRRDLPQMYQWIQKNVYNGEI